MSSIDALAPFVTQLIEKIQKEAPEKTPEESRLRRLDSLTFDLDLGICQLSITDDKIPVYRRLDPLHLARVKSMTPTKYITRAFDKFVTEVADTFMKMPPHYQLSFSVGKLTTDEIMESMQQPTERQKEFLISHKIFDFCQVSLPDESPQKRITICLFSQTQQTDLAAFTKKFMQIIAPCNNAIIDFLDETVRSRYFKIIPRESGDQVVGMVTYGAFEKYIDIALSSDAKMRKVVQLQPVAVQEFIKTFNRQVFQFQTVQN